MMTKNNSMFKSYSEFIYESEKVKVNKEVREYTLTHKNDAVFELKGDDFIRQFSVTPYKGETIKKLRESHDKLIRALDTLNVESMYSAIQNADRVNYNYGDVFSDKFSLKAVTSLELNLTDDQKTILNSSEKDFLLNDFSHLDKNTKDEIIKELRDRCEITACVLEALFYYIRTTDKDEYYDRKNAEEILEEYEDSIGKAKEEYSFVERGPFSKEGTEEPLKYDSKITGIVKRMVLNFT